ncbi:hypothetical protein [Vreelandella sp. TE19]
MQKVEFWIVTLSSEYSMSDMATHLQEQGLQIKEQLDAIGCITGEADSAAAERIRCLEGVIDIAPDTPLNIGPPDADQTW